MIRHARFALSLTALSLIAASCGGGAGSMTSDVTLAGDDVRVTTDQLDITFARKEPVLETYMIFGGMDSNRSDSASKITLVGLGMEDARPIHARYPDFTMCKSQGAGQAMRATRQLDIVPKDGVVLGVLQDALARHKASLQSGSERICVAITGSTLGWKSALVDGNEVIDELPAPIKRDHVLVETARIVGASDALGTP